MGSDWIYNLTMTGLSQKVVGEKNNLNMYATVENLENNTSVASSVASKKEGDQSIAFIDNRSEHQSIIQQASHNERSNALSNKSRKGFSLMQPPKIINTDVIQRTGPGDAPPTISEQLEVRLDNRNEKGAFPDEKEVLQELDEVMLLLPPPTTAVTNAHELIGVGLSDYMFSKKRDAATDLVTMSAGLLNCMFQTQQKYPAVAALTVDHIGNEIQNQVQPLIRRVVKAWCTNKGAPVPTDVAIDAIYQISAQGIAIVQTNNTSALRFLADNPQQPGFTGSLTPTNHDDLVAALEKMPIVKAAYAKKPLFEEHPLTTKALSASAAGVKSVHGWIHPTVLIDDGSQRGLGEEDSDRLMPENNVPGDMKERIAKAMQIVFGLVDSHLLSSAIPPKIYVHLTEDKSLLRRIKARDFSQAKTLRAYSESYQNAIHVDQSDSVPIIVHEVGHQIEDLLPTKLWLDIQRLLHARHDAAVVSGAPNTVDQIYPNADASDLRSEVAYRSAMPATGMYSAKVYDGPGATEVLSRSMEFLADRITAQKLIQKDPLQAAIILRGIAPTEFTACVAPKFIALLP